jgi:hypothetical protein
MCLYTRQDEPFVAEEDIVCYKRLVLNKSDMFVTPVIGRKIPDAVISGRRLYRARGIFRCAYRDPVFPWVNIVDRGWVHTYTSTPIFFYGDDGVWFECVIPKGTKYWKSKNGNEYASSSIRFVKPCEKQIYALFSEVMGRFPAEHELSLSDIVGSLERTKEFFKNLAQ